jgi:hypothetical protein
MCVVSKITLELHLLFIYLLFFFTKIIVLIRLFRFPLLILLIIIDYAINSKNDWNVTMFEQKARLSSLETRRKQVSSQPQRCSSSSRTGMWLSSFLGSVLILTFRLSQKYYYTLVL